MIPFTEQERPLIRTVFILTCICLCFISCAQAPGKVSSFQDTSFFDGEVISLLGDTLQPPADDEETFHLKDSLLQEAYNAYLADSNDLDNIIWMGRRLAYLYRYKEAIHTFTRGIHIHPDSPELYRHRGHRFITVRKIDDAIHDLTKGISLAKNKPREIEPDGIPNKLNIPLSNLHFNLYYHLGLAYYLKADYQSAIGAYKECMEYSDNPDLKVATTDWWFLTYMRTGDTISAQNLLKQIHPDMEIIENNDYLMRLLLYKGQKGLSTFHSSSDPLTFATRNYGISCWHEMNGRRAEASALRYRILESGFWPSFGFIAAEADSVRLKSALK